MAKFTPKQLAAQSHNRLMGHIAMIQQLARVIEESPTVNENGKKLARSIRVTSANLDCELRAKRIDP